MSTLISTWVWHHSEAKGNELLILLALADQADDAGICWPSVTKLAAKTRLSERTIQTYLRALEETGTVTIEERSGTSNRYTVNTVPRRTRTPRGADSAGVGVQILRGAESAPVQTAAPGGASGCTPGVQTAAPYTSLNHQEPSLVDGDAGASFELDIPAPPQLTVDELFTLFWENYPRREGRKPARAAFERAARVLDGASLVQAAAAYRDDHRRPADLTKVPHASTWLNQERWNDELPDRRPAPAMTNAQRAIALANSIPEGAHRGPEAHRAAVGQSL